MRRHWKAIGMMAGALAIFLICVFGCRDCWIRPDFLSSSLDGQVVGQAKRGVLQITAVQTGHSTAPSVTQILMTKDRRSGENTSLITVLEWQDSATFHFITDDSLRVVFWSSDRQQGTYELNINDTLLPASVYEVERYRIPPDTNRTPEDTLGDHNQSGI